MFANRLARNEQSSLMTFHRCFLPSFDSFGQAVSEGKILKKSANQNQELPGVSMFGNRSSQNVHALERTFRRCVIPSLSSFGLGVSEVKIKM
jgi:hypothetical protein